MKQATNNRRFPTAGRLTFTALVFAAAALAASSCKSDDTANLSANQAKSANGGKPTVTITQQRGAQPPQAQLEEVPALAWDRQLQDVNGTSFRLSDYKDKVVVLDLWATWCGPCRLEVPHLVEMSNEYAGKGVEVIGLTTESPQADADKVRDFAREFKINYKVGYAPADVAQALMNGNFSIPQTFVIAPGGRIVTKFRGFSNQVPDMIRAAVTKASEKTGD